MRLAVKGRHVEASERLSEHVRVPLKSDFIKYFTSAVAAHLVFRSSELASTAQFLNQTEPEDVHEEGREELNSLAPFVAAEATTDITKLSVGEQVLRKNMLELPARIYLNLSHNDMNVLFQSADGQISFFGPQIKTAE